MLKKRKKNAALHKGKSSVSFILFYLCMVSSTGEEGVAPKEDVPTYKRNTLYGQ